MRKYWWCFQFLLLFRNLTNTEYLQNRLVKAYQDCLKLDKELGSKSKAAIPVVQNTLEKSIAVTVPFAFDHPRARAIHLAIGEMVCVDCLPFYTVENLGSFV